AKSPATESVAEVKTHARAVSRTCRENISATESGVARGSPAFDAALGRGDVLSTGARHRAGVGFHLGDTFGRRRFRALLRRARAGRRADPELGQPVRL